MNTPHSNIVCGSTTIRYHDSYGAWMLPNKTFTKNPLKAHRVAEETEQKREKHKLSWEIYEIQYLIEHNQNINHRAIAKCLERSVSDVKAMIAAISPSN